MTGSATSAEKPRSRSAPERTSKVEPTVGSLAEYVSDARARGLRVVHCHGVFDVLHPGVVRLLESARRAADRLVVTVVDDRRVGPACEPLAFNQRLRSEAVAALGDVDRVAVATRSGTLAVAEAVQADVFAASPDLRRVERTAVDPGSVRALGIEPLADTALSLGSPSALNDLFGVFRSETEDYLCRMRERFDAPSIVERLEALRSLRVLVIGDVIIDEYHYCKAIGKSSKSATLTARFLSAERHAGGVLAVANHVAGFAGDVRLLTFAGTPRSEESFVRSHLQPNVRPSLIPDPARTTVVKRRYVDPFQVSKMFEVMWLDGESPNEDREDELLERLPDLVDDCDVVLVCDFGHGTVGSRTIDWLCANAPFLAVNTQTNSANLGYNLVTKYPRADYLCIDEQELHLAQRTRSVDVEALLDVTAREAGATLATVTLGGRGSLTWSREGHSVRTPVLSSNVVDSVGAGDAYLSVTSLCAFAGWEPELIGLIGNCVGALAVHIIGNRESIGRETLAQHVESLL